MTTIKASFRITIKGETRWIECSAYWSEKYEALYEALDRFTSVAPVTLARVGRTGSKLWPSRITVWRDKQPNAEGVYGWHASTNSIHLNRQAQIVDWNRPELARYFSQHNSASSYTPDAKAGS